MLSPTVSLIMGSSRFLEVQRCLSPGLPQTPVQDVSAWLTAACRNVVLQEDFMVTHQVMWVAPWELIVGWPDQVLGNAELRARYDAHGAEALDVNFMDSAEFFTALFGSDRFDHLVGELMIAVAARSNGEFLQGQMRKLQARTATSPCYFACGGPAALCACCVSLRGCSFFLESLTLQSMDCMGSWVAVVIIRGTPTFPGIASPWSCGLCCMILRGRAAPVRRGSPGALCLESGSV